MCGRARVRVERAVWLRKDRRRKQEKRQEEKQRRLCHFTGSCTLVTHWQEEQEEKEQWEREEEKDKEEEQEGFWLRGSGACRSLVALGL